MTAQTPARYRPIQSHTEIAPPPMPPTEAQSTLAALSDAAESISDTESDAAESISDMASLANTMLVCLFADRSYVLHGHRVLLKLQDVMDMRKEAVRQLAQEARGAHPPTQYTLREWEEWIGAHEFSRDQMNRALEI